MTELWEQLADSLSKKIDDLATANLRSFMERFCRSEIKVIYSESEAAAFLGVSRDTLSHWRKRGIIEYAAYPSAKKDELSDMFSYDIAALLSFRERYIKRTPAKNVFEINPVISLAGPELKRMDRAA